MNVYHELKKELDESKCTKCNGRGKQDDMGIGDTYFNEWECENCNGTGMDKNSRIYKKMM